MAKRAERLASIAAIIADYRAGEIPTPTPEHVDRWVRQFPEEAQRPILRELDHVLKQTYFSRARTEEFLKEVMVAPKLAGPDPSAFWADVTFLQAQQHGSSQRDMVAALGALLHAEYGVVIDDPVTEPSVFVYLDDGIFSGDTLRFDVRRWINEEARPEAQLHVIVFALHTGFWYARKQIDEAIAASGKRLTVNYWRALEVKNKRSERHVSGVLWPSVLPEDDVVQAYVATLQYPVTLRQATGGDPGVFSSEEGRQTLERELLVAGARIRADYQNPSEMLRPLGYSRFGLGFGAMTVTFRNCPNNAPLALWWGNIDGNGPAHFNNWYPLFPRRTYHQGEGDFSVFFP